MKKKLLVFVILFLFSFQLISPCTFAYEYNYDYEYDYGIDFLKAVGLVGGDVSGDKIITRMELAKIIYTILYGKSNYSYFEPNVYQDVEERDYPIVIALAEKQIMTGLGDGIYGSNNPVTYHQLIKVLVTFLGYGDNAEIAGGYPMGYLVVGKQIGLTKKLVQDGNALVTYSAVNSLMLQALNVNIKLQTSYGKENYEVQKNLNYLEYYLDIKVKSGLVNANSLTNIYSGSNTRDNQVEIDGVLMTLTDATYSLKNKLGYYVNVFYKDEDPTPIIIYWMLEKNTTTEIDSDAVISAYENTIIFENADGKRERLSLCASTVVVYNGTYLGSYTQEDLNPFQSSNLDGSIIAIDNNSDGIQDVIFINAYKSYLVTGVREEKIYNKYEPNVVIDVSNYKDGLLQLVNVMDEPILPEKIQKDHVISVFRDKNGNIKKVIVANDNYISTVDEIIYADKSIDSLKVNNMYFKVSRALVTRNEESLRVGTKVKLYFDYAEKIFAVEILNVDDNDYEAGYLVSASKSKIGGEYKFQILTSQGRFDIFDVPNTLTINNQRGSAEELFLKIGYIADNMITRQLLLYKINGNVITEVYLCDDSLGAHNGLYHMPGYEGGVVTNEKAYKEALKTFNGRFSVDNSTKVFIVANEENKNDLQKYMVGGIELLGDNDTSVSVEAFGTTEDGLRASYLVLGESAMEKIKLRDPIFVVDSIIDVVTEDGTIKKKVTGCMVERTVASAAEFTADVDVLSVGPDNSLPASGDILRTSAIVNGEVKKIQFLYRRGPNTLHITGNPTNVVLNVSDRYSFGKVESKDTANVRLRLYNANSTMEVHNLKLGNYKIIECSKSGNGYKVRISDMNCILAERDYGDNASDMFVYIRGGTGIAAVVYNESN